MRTLALVAHRGTPTNIRLAACPPAGVRVTVLTPARALARLAPGDVALGRLDVLPTLDGIEPGLWALDALALRGVRVLNRSSALVAAHDKLVTARTLKRAGLPHPRTAPIADPLALPELAPPVVLKPRFGSWGRDVFLCTDRASLLWRAEELARRPWFESAGGLVQELVQPQGYDLRVVVAGGRVVGAVKRVAALGEWRTNVSLGASREHVTPPREACELALAGAAAASVDLVGVDLLPTPDGGWTILELNSAVDFTSDYSLQGDVFEQALQELLRPPLVEPRKLVAV